MADECRAVDIDGVPVLVRTSLGRELTETDRAALTELVQLCRARLDAEGPGAAAIRIGTGMYQRQRIHALRERIEELPND